MIGKLKRELEEKAYQKRLSELKKYEQEIDEFVFLVPKELQEIVDEGNKLFHCFGSKDYLNNHTSGKTNIIFIRRKEEVNKPYFTLEYRNQRIGEVQGYKNKEKIPQNVQQAISKWEKKIKKIS